MTAIDTTESATVDETTAGKATRSKWLALYVVCVGVLMIVLDQSCLLYTSPSPRDS